MNIYSFSAETITGEKVSLSTFRNQVLLIVNTASKCGFTPQYKDLQQLYDRYREQGFAVLAFPSNQFLNQEPGTDEEIQSFCQLHYGVTFPLFRKVDVRGRHAHPLFDYLTREAPGFLSRDIKWNFTKFLVNRRGQVVKRYAPATRPATIERDIQALLAEPV